MKASVHIEIAREQAALFALSQDYARRLEWDPYLSRTELLHGALVAAVGVEAYCQNKSGTGMITRYIAYEPPRVAAVTMTEGPRILEQFNGSWRFEGITEVTTKVVFTYSIRTKPTCGRWIVEPIVCGIFFAQMKSRLYAFKRYAESLS